MTHKALIGLGALAIAGAAQAALVTVQLSGTGMATGSLSSLGELTMTMTLTYDDSASALASNTAFGAWSYAVTNSASQTIYAASGNASSGTKSTYVGWTSGSTQTRRYTVILGGMDVANSHWLPPVQGTGKPAITMVEIGYVAARTGTTYGTMGQSISGSSGSGGGFLMAVANGNPSSFGTMGSPFFSFAPIPTPGAAALLSVAGLVSLRRRRA